jgi:Sulfotransferase family
MSKNPILIKKTLRMIVDFPLSFCGGFKNRADFKDIETFFLFIGYPRSGHTLIGSLLDAHQNIACGHELSVLNYLLAGFSKRQIFYLLTRSSKSFTRQGRRWNGYSYLVRGQWQGIVNGIRIIGDKKGGGTTVRMKSHPQALNRMNKIMGKQTRYIHVIRNPFDNITTISQKHGMPLDESIEYYFSLCETVQWIKSKICMSFYFEMKHESFIKDPFKELNKLCQFLGTGANKDYLTACSAIVFPSPRKTRKYLAWNTKQIRSVEKKMAAISYLNDYAYDD